MDESKDLKYAIQKNINKIKAATITATTTTSLGTTTVDPFVLMSGATNDLICPPPVFTSFAPLSGYTGTIVQVNGRYLSTTKEVKLMNKVVPFKDVTIYSDETLRFIVPQIATGTVAASGKIEVKTDHGTFTGAVLFNYNPALSGVTTSSPGSYTNPAAANKIPPSSATTGITETKLASSNLNPQNTGPIILSAVTDTKDSIGSNTQLTVRVGPDAGAWRIDTQPEFNYKVIQITPGPDGKYKGERITSASGSRLIGYVSADQQQFSINKIQMLDEIRESLDPDEMENSKIYTSIELYARPIDRIKNPQDVIQTYNFNLFLTDRNVGDPVSNTVTSPTTGRTFAQKTISIIKVGESDSLQGNGWQYFNIKKPAGGYITFKFDAPEFSTANYGGKFIVNLNNNLVSYSLGGGADTKYTNLVTVNDLGEFKLKVEYRPYGYTAPIGGQVLTQTVYSPIFTL